MNEQKAFNPCVHVIVMNDRVIILLIENDAEKK